MRNPFVIPPGDAYDMRPLRPHEVPAHAEYYAPVDNSENAFRKFQEKAAAAVEDKTDAWAFIACGGRGCGKTALVYRCADWLRGLLLTRETSPTLIIDLSREDPSGVDSKQRASRISRRVVDRLAMQRTFDDSEMRTLRELVDRGDGYDAFPRLKDLLWGRGVSIIVLPPLLKTTEELAWWASVAGPHLAVICESREWPDDLTKGIDSDTAMRLVRLEVGPLSVEDGWVFVESRLAKAADGDPTTDAETVLQFMWKRTETGPVSVLELNRTCSALFEEAVRQSRSRVTLNDFYDYYLRMGSSRGGSDGLSGEGFPAPLRVQGSTERGPRVERPDDHEQRTGPAVVEGEAAQEPAAEASEVDARTAIGTVEGANNDAIGEEDQLGFAYYVRAFADLITSPHSKPPLTIGIYGSWGAGKSFLLNHIEREVLSREQEAVTGSHVGPRVQVIRFNAWEYSASAEVWPGLVRRIVERLDEDVPWPWYRRYWTRFKWNLPRALRRSWPALAATALVVATLITAALVRGRTGVAATVATVVVSLGIGGMVKAASNPVAHWVITLFADNDYGRRIGFMEAIKHDLETLERRLHENGDPSARVVGRILVVIDDLDRCEPEKVVEVLQAINLLLNFNSFIVCLGIDARIVAGAVEKHYQGLLGSAGASGYEYLDKIVQIPFRIPAPSVDEVTTFIERQLEVKKPLAGRAKTDYGGQVGGPDINEDAGSPSEPEELLEPGLDDRVRALGGEAPPANPVVQTPEAAVAFTFAELEAFKRLAPYLRPNPRHLKRLINVYRLVRALARAKQEDTILCNPSATIRWLVMWSQWPYTCRTILDRFDEVLEDRSDAPCDDAGRDPLSELLEEVAPKLKPEVRDRLDDEADLADVLKLDGFGLSWAEIGRIRRYTVNFNPAIEEYLRELTPSGEGRVDGGQADYPKRLPRQRTRDGSEPGTPASQAKG